MNALALSRRVLPAIVVVVIFATFVPFKSAAVTFTNNTTIGLLNGSYEGAEVVISNCTVTMDGAHSFSNVLIAAGGVLTHTSDGSGTTTYNLYVTDEPQTLTETNAVSLVHSNVYGFTIEVWNFDKTLQYGNGSDYNLTTDAGGLTWLARTLASTIPSGSNVLVSYGYLVTAWPARVDLTVAGDVTVAAGGSINGAGRGGGTSGLGGSAGSPASGAGGGNGGLGGVSSSNAVSGANLGSFFSVTNLGGAGGAGVGGNGARGGSAVVIQCGGTFTLDGTINVSGANATNSRAGGGAGGSVWIAATNFTGAGSIAANGGAGEPIHGGGGGGGRIALEFATNTFSGAMSAAGGAGWQAGGAGTLFVRQFGTGGQLTLDNTGLAGAGTPVSISGTPNLTVAGRAAMLLQNASTVGELLVRSNSSILTLSTNNATLSLSVQTNATIEATAQLNVNGRGYFRGTGLNLGTTFSGFGGGGGHGGYGGRLLVSGTSTNATSGSSYDSVSGPTQSGSGAAGSFTANGSGGGVIRLIVSGTLQLDGDLRADATSGTSDLASGGAGGSVWVTAGTLAGNGRMTADGGAGGINYAGGGAGGRIAVFYTSNNFAGTFSARGGNAGFPGGAGTIYIKPANQAYPNLIVDNGGPRGAITLLEVAQVNTLTIASGATLSNYFTSQTVGNMVVGTNATFQGGYYSAYFSITGNVSVATGGVISLDGSSTTSSGPGTGGGGHGGAGGRGSTSSGGSPVGDSASFPSQWGNSGGYGFGSTGGKGGGVLTLSVQGLLQLDGRLTANGLDANNNSAGGGAGGAVYVTATRFAGNGSITADGGVGNLPSGGGGGGGRIAVLLNSTNNTFTGSFSAKGGNGYQRGGAGTIFYKRSTLAGPTLVVDNGGVPGTNTVASVTGFGSVDVTVQGGGMLSGWSGAALANLTVRSNSWFGTNGSFNIISNVTVEATGGIRLDGINTSSSGGGSPSTRGGAGHGGSGGLNSSPYGQSYDSISAPASPGSTGGGAGSPLGGRGGGFLQLTVLGLLQLDGNITADGWNGEVGAGGGSGGGLRLILNSFKGTGNISANGGAGIPSGGLGGGGGGGRIAVTWNRTFSNQVENIFTGTYSARGGDGVLSGGAGTIYLKRNDQSFATVTMDNGGLIAATNTPLGSSFGQPSASTPWNLTVSGGAIAYPVVTVSYLSNLLINAGGQFTCAPGATSLPLTVLDNLVIAPGGALTVDGKGYGRQAGSGAGATINSKGAGGGYGGFGGASSSNAKGGTNYGSATQPTDRGSGGGAGANSYINGCEGGGAIKLVVPGTLTVNGTLSANGSTGFQDDSGGGAGGSIWVMANSIGGAGAIVADGGDGDLYGGGGGGGGRIALYANATNTFTGYISALGGDGAGVGQDGSLLFTTNLLPFSLTSAAPTGLTSNTAEAVTFYFNQIVDPASVSPATFTLTMPAGYTGPTPTISVAVGAGTAAASAIFQPGLNLPGDYTLIVSPTITDIFGTPMTEPFTNTFTLAPPTVEGFVFDTNSVGVAGVTVRTANYIPTTTDATGHYSLGVPMNWSGIIAPSFGAKMFLPGSIALADVTAPVTNQNFVMVDTILPSITSGVAGTNLFFNWTGMAGVTYQAYTSTDLVNWFLWGDPLPGTNAPMEIQIPVSADGQSFFRLGASN